LSSPSEPKIRRSIASMLSRGRVMKCGSIDTPFAKNILGRGRRGAFSGFRLCARHGTLVDRSRAATGGRLLKCEQQSSKDSRAVAKTASRAVSLAARVWCSSKARVGVCSWGLLEARQARIVLANASALLF
jgi:hypothetical protein